MFREHADGFHTTVLENGVEFRVSERYGDVKFIASGAYGTVASAYDRNLKRPVALKRVDVRDDVKYCKRLLRELMVLRSASHPNIVKLHSIEHIANPDDFASLYFSVDLMETDLYNIIMSPQELSTSHVQFFMHQILSAVSYLHSAGILHRDLKPSNVLINSDCDIKVCDFGLASDIGESKKATRVVTRWYRAPELLLGREDYGKGIDVWSAACIMGELLGRQVLFRGEESGAQFNLITRLRGLPVRGRDFPKELVLPATLEKVWQRCVDDGVGVEATPLREVYPSASDLALDLLEKMLKYNLDERISAQDAMEHPFFADFQENSTSTATFRLSFDYEKEVSDLAGIRRLLYLQSLYFNPRAPSLIITPFRPNKPNSRVSPRPNSPAAVPASAGSPAQGSGDVLDYLRAIDGGSLPFGFTFGGHDDDTSSSDDDEVRGTTSATTPRTPRARSALSSPDEDPAALGNKKSPHMRSLSFQVGDVDFGKYASSYYESDSEDEGALSDGPKGGVRLRRHTDASEGRLPKFGMRPSYSDSFDDLTDEEEGEGVEVGEGDDEEEAEDSSDDSEEEEGEYDSLRVSRLKKSTSTIPSIGTPPIGKRAPETSLVQKDGS